MVISRLILLLVPLILMAQEDFSQYKQSQTEAFKQEKRSFINFQKAQDRAYTQHRKASEKAIKNFKKTLKAIWPKAQISTVKKLVNYSDDLHTKSVIDFEKNIITISTIDNKNKNIKKSLLKTLDKTLNLDSKEAFKEDKLEQTINTFATKSKYIKTGSVDKVKLLKTEFDSAQERPKKIKIIKEGKLYKLSYKLPSNSTYKRSLNYLVLAKSNAVRFNLEPEILLAIMHTESSFNPLAKSHIPAYGLMQIVPHSAGIDSYKFLYHKRRLLSASYLYNSKRNIEIGAAYFHILYYKYLKDIKDPTSRLYCSIAGYNTGAGNVARAFVGNNNTKKAALKINTMSSLEVYNYLLQNLRYNEPKVYLKRVKERSVKYKSLYRL